MNDIFVPPSIPVTELGEPPAVPRRLLNDRLYLDRMDDAPEAPMTASKKMTLRFYSMPQILVNDAGMVRNPTIKGGSF